MNTTSRVLLTAILCVAAAACTKKVKEDPDTGATQSGPSSGATSSGIGNTGPSGRNGLYGPGDLDTDACLRQRVVYFDFDQDALKPEFQTIVACHAKYLRDRPSARMTLEGNADERGSREYNLGLGERRGNAVSSAVQANGGSGTQITVVSYGEERPTCTESTEDCWGRNRRVEIVYTEK
ncbi:MAG: peptidoglycan-associated lipoprotein Pal [Pseudomonadota bacterium]